jgi:hypothetical protein
MGCSGSGVVDQTVNGLDSHNAGRRGARTVRRSMRVLQGCYRASCRSPVLAAQAGEDLDSPVSEARAVAIENVVRARVS